MVLPSYARATRCPVLRQPISVRCCYALSSTDKAYGYAASGTELAYGAICCYAVSGTELAYGATRRG
eukprot:3462467-Rhodomonas_salina.3